MDSTFYFPSSPFFSPLSVSPRHSPHRHFYLSCNPAFSITFLSFHHFLSGFLGFYRGLEGPAPGQTTFMLLLSRVLLRRAFRNVHLFSLATHIPAFIQSCTTFILHFLLSPLKTLFAAVRRRRLTSRLKLSSFTGLFCSLEFFTLSTQMPSSGHFRNKPINVSRNNLKHLQGYTPNHQIVPVKCHKLISQSTFCLLFLLAQTRFL